MTPAAGTVTKRKLSPGQAAEQWEKAERDIAKAKALREEAEPIVLEHMVKKDLTTFKGVLLTETSPRTILDQAKVREFLGKKLADFQTRTEAKKKLALLKK